MDNVPIPAVTGAIAAIPPSMGVFVVWLQNKARFDGIDQRFDAMNQRFDDMRDLWRAELRRVEKVLDAQLKHLEEK
jgi:hypothetical protein